MRYNGITYLISEGFRNLFKNKKGTFSSLITMICAMFLFGIFFTIGENINTIMFLYKLSLFSMKYEFIILNIFEINIHFAIPILFDIIIKNGDISPVIRNLIP